MHITAGTRIGSYEIVDSLGSGGMGNVYRARALRLAREVAIKALPDDLAQNSAALERFEREARFLASLNHPNIAAIYGIEEHGGERFAFDDPDVRIDYPVWSPDGRWLLFDRFKPEWGDIWMAEIM